MYRNEANFSYGAEMEFLILILILIRLFYFQTGSFSMDDEHYMIEPYTAGINASDHNYENANTIPHLLYTWNHSHSHNHSEPAHSVDAGKKIIYS